MQIRLDEKFFNEVYQFYQNKSMGDSSLYRTGDYYVYAIIVDKDTANHPLYKDILHEGEKVFNFCKEDEAPIIAIASDISYFDVQTGVISVDLKGTLLMNILQRLKNQHYCNNCLGPCNSNCKQLQQEIKEDLIKYINIDKSTN